MSEAIRALFSRPTEEPPAPPLRGRAVAELQSLAGRLIYDTSLAVGGDTLYFMTKQPDRSLGRARLHDDKIEVDFLPLCHGSANIVRRELPWTAPQLVGLRTSLGLGDRLGLAAPGHLRAVAGTGVFPVLAQQSIRELTRTHRNPEEVMDAATYGALQEGWRAGFGSDADHLKTFNDIDVTACESAGFTMFTIDPGDHVRDEADTLDAAALDAALAEVPWDSLRMTQADFTGRYAGQTFDLGDPSLECSAEAAARAIVKYGGAVAHTASMHEHLRTAREADTFELEMSVDETESPTSPVEHYIVAAELARLGVKPVSLAPRFIGRFEKGVDFIGDRVELERTFRQHVAIARALGPYKLSIHSGSDKFSVYEVAAECADGLVHVKTAGTSYLEALRAIARVEPGFFREILAFALNHWETDRATYHVSADPARVRPPDGLPDEELPGVLDEFDARQVLHVTFGSVLTEAAGGEYTYRNRLLKTLQNHEDEHYAALAAHLGKHAAPFAA
jgi:hypothetical protein